MKHSARVSCLLVLALSVAAAAQDPLDKYIWQTYRTRDIPASAQPMIDELRAEVQKVLDAGPLAPLRTVYADVLDDPYFILWQPGRIITTLAMAYPHLTPEQQQKVRQYVRAELADENRAPWSPAGHIPPDQGARREIHTFNKPLGWDRYWGMWGRSKPVIASIYGLWLYADRSGDWDAIRPHYERLVRFYSAKAAQGDLYGTMGAHIGMARIARHFNDQPTLDAAVTAARAALEIGRSLEEVERRAEQKYYRERYNERQRGRSYAGWFFLDMAPEIGRFLAENVKEAVLERHQSGMRRYPLFWLREVNYSGGRWTGDEGVGIPTELMAMLVPVERWVAGASAQTLAGYTRSTPIGIGDCYWLEMLVTAIEAAGTTTWEELPR